LAASAYALFWLHRIHQLMAAAYRSAAFKPGSIIQPGPVFGVALAAIEKFRPNWSQRLVNCAPWLWLPALGLIAYALYLGETDNLTVSACVWQFPLIALGMAALLVCAVSPRLPFRRVAIPGAAFIASIAYSAYLIQKLVINGVEQFCSSHNIQPTSALALLGVELCVYAAATLLFLVVERLFLQLRHRIAPRSSPAAAGRRLAPPRNE
jgi:peptidoglycan/LPS O-acetylase OafA/YrhL